MQQKNYIRIQSENTFEKIHEYWRTLETSAYYNNITPEDKISGQII
ncbi:MAG: hypothetical protein V8S39_00765 [Lachnospiraceae bacterium]